MTARRHKAPPGTWELVAVLLTGIAHVTIELLSDGLAGSGDELGHPQHIFNLGACCAWGVYLVWRVARGRSVLVEWGFRKAGFLPSLAKAGLFALISIPVLALYGWWMGRLPVPRTLWLLAALYPLWGIPQQFALQGLITRNLRGWVPQLPVRVGAAALFFSLAHFPNYPLMGLTFPAGVVFGLIYEKHRNLWAIGMVHGLLGASAYYLVLGEDLGATLLGLLP